MPKNRVPFLVKHCTVAIYKKGGIEGGTDNEKFISAWNIARARLTEYGFLSKGSDQGPASKIKLTGKGLKREAEHRREKGGAAKNKLFDSLYSVLQDQEIVGKKKE